MAKTYVDFILEGKEQESLIEFYANNIDENDLLKYSSKELSAVAKDMILLLSKTNINSIVETIETNTDKLHEISKENIPQFSNIDFIKDVLYIVEANPGCNFELIGYNYNKNARKGAQTKYGENHYKLAAMMCLTTSQGSKRLTNIGKECLHLQAIDFEALKPKLYLRIPIIQQVIIQARYSKVNVVDIMREHLAESTILRRKPNVKLLINSVCNVMANSNELRENISWCDKNGKRFFKY